MKRRQMRNRERPATCQKHAAKLQVIRETEKRNERKIREWLGKREASK